MSNVEHHEESFAFLLHMSLRSPSQSQPACAAPLKLGKLANPALLGPALLQGASRPQPERVVASAPHRGTSDEQGSQSVGAAVSGGGRAVAARPLKLALRAPRRAARSAPRHAQDVMLNPSIERTSPGKPGAASHVKR
jgi:hypothetical protein